MSERKAQNRARMPEGARCMDMLAEFSPRMIWWEENGHTVGKKP